MAQETAKVLSGRGQIVLLVGTARNQSGTEQYYEVDGFLREVKKHPQLQITKTITHTFIETPTTDLGHDIRTFYEQLLNEHRDADALVTFIELPILTPEQPLDLPAAHPKILAAHMNITQGKTYLRDKLIVAFIANRENPPSSPPTGATTSREMFDKYYQLFTSANLDALD
ncbi:MAG: hypothetical protein PCFJNLEI_03833 [Verrucomicrobiae bacterium]|nr:hypothetical protein [Verrucomicrobiae bacterium]